MLGQLFHTFPVTAIQAVWVGPAFQVRGGTFSVCGITDAGRHPLHQNLPRDETPLEDGPGLGQIVASMLLVPISQLQP